MRQHHFLSHLVPNRTIKLLGRACALTVLLCLSNSSFAENKLLATEVSNAEGWREFHIAVDAKRYAWCGPGTKLVVDTKKDGIKLIDVATWKVQEISKGSNPDCSHDGKYIYFRVVQPRPVKFVQMATATWTRREFDALVYGTIQISANGRYIFFTSSGPDIRSHMDGLYYLDVPSGKVFTIHKQQLPTFKSDHHVSPGMKYFVALPDWQGKTITLVGGEKLTAVPLPIAPSGKIFDENYSADDWVWTPDDLKLVTLNWRTQKAFLVRVYDTATGKYLASTLSPEGVEYFGASLKSGVGNKVYIYAGQSDYTGAQRLQIDLDQEPSVTTSYLKSMSSFDLSATGVSVFSRRYGAKVDRLSLDTELSQDPRERLISFYVMDEKGRETRIRYYPFVSDPFVYSEPDISRNGRVIALSRRVAEFSDERRLVILIQN